uniref:Uncharacterized protein n=1 Tax=Arundo donax TaxID=35708 RepID=A0A0A9AXJ7_ARUDO
MKLCCCAGDTAFCWSRHVPSFCKCSHTAVRSVLTTFCRCNDGLLVNLRLTMRISSIHSKTL